MPRKENESFEDYKLRRKEENITRRAARRGKVQWQEFYQSAITSKVKGVPFSRAMGHVFPNESNPKYA